MIKKQSVHTEFIQLLPQFYDGTPEGFWNFCKAYLPALFQGFPKGTKITEMQRDMIAQLLDPKTEFLPERRLVTMWYRGAGKTTTSDAFCVYLIIGKWYNDRREEEYRLSGRTFNRVTEKAFLFESKYMVIYSFTEDAAARRVKTIADCFTNKKSYPFFVADFGHLLVNKPKEKIGNIYQSEVFDEVKIKRSETILAFSHGCRVEALGMGQAIQGGNIGGQRPDFLRFDDPENPRSRDNKVDLFRRNLDFITNDCYGSVDKLTGRIHVIGTNIAPGCTVDVLTSPDSTWRKNVFPHVTTPVPLNRDMMYSDTQVSTDPQRFPLKLIRLEYEAKLQEGDLRGFYRDMYNIAYDPNSIDTTRIKCYSPSFFTLQQVGTHIHLLSSPQWSNPKRAVVSIGIDAGGAKVGNNKTAISIAALTSDRDLVILKNFLLNKPAMTQSRNGYFDDIYNLATTYRPTHIVFEAYGGGYQTVFDNLCVYFQTLDREKGERHAHKLVAFNDSTKSKRDRAFPLLKSFIESDKLYFPEDDMPIFEKQIQSLSSGSGGEDDLVDAIVLSQYNLYPPAKDSITFQRNLIPKPFYESQRTRLLNRVYRRQP